MLAFERVTAQAERNLQDVQDAQIGAAERQ